jgi:glycosyltransferase involved in cell wall biosynthesis
MTKFEIVPSVSIGMPVYNGEKYIRETLDSLLAQTFTDFELIISDNASTDATEIICREYAAHNPKIRYLRQRENRGATANFQFVLDEAVGEYFMWAAADDLCKPEFIEYLISELEKNNDFVLMMSDVENISANGSSLYISKLDNIRIEDVKRSWSRIQPLFFKNPTTQIFFGIFGIFRTNVLRKVSLNYLGLVKYASGSEIPLLAQVASLGMVGSIAKVLKIYRRHENSVYHKEQKGMGFGQQLYNHINISVCLLNIVIRSEMKASEKVRALLALGYSSSFHLVKFFVIYPPLRVIRRILDIMSKKITGEKT